MSIQKITKDLKDATYFLTLTVHNWYYIFDRHNRFQILADSLSYCQKHKNLRLHAYVFMLNHIHLVASAPDMIAFVRDFKKFTSAEMQKNIAATEPNGIKLFASGVGQYEFWQHGNMPKLIETDEFLNQKIEYIHANPVRKQYVKNPEDWVWSSANHESTIKIDEILV